MTARTSSSRLAWVLSLVGVSWSLSATADSDARGLLLQRAAQARGDGNHAEALAAAEQAHVLKPSAAVARFLAEELVELERQPEAWLRAQECLTRVRTEPRSDNREAVRKGCEYLRGELGAELAFLDVRVPVEPSDIDLDVSGLRVPGRTRWVAPPGTFRVVARHEGHRPFEREIIVGAGQFASVEVHLEPITSSPPPAQPRRAAAPAPGGDTKSSPSNRSGVGPVVLVSVGAAALAAAVLTHLEANSRFDELRRDCQDGCRGTRRKRNIDRLDSWVLGLGVGGAISMAGGALWWALQTPSDQPPGLGRLSAFISGYRGAF